MCFFIWFFHYVITCFLGVSTIIPPFQLPRNGASNQSSSWPPSLLASQPLNVEHPPPNQNPPGGLSKLGGFQISKRFINGGLIWCSSQIHVSWEDMLGIYVVSTYICRYKPFPFISYAMTNFRFSGAFQQVSWKSDQGHWSRWRWEDGESANSRCQGVGYLQSFH